MAENREEGIDWKHLKWKIKKARDSAAPGAAAWDAAASVWRCLASHRAATSGRGRGRPLLTALQIGLAERFGWEMPAR